MSKVSTISSNEEIKSIYLPNQTCQLVSDILSNLLYSSEDIGCVKSILDTY